jgi:hypothetical protein
VAQLTYQRSALGVGFRNALASALDASPETFTAVCKRAGYSTCYVRRILVGAKPNPTLLFVESMAAALDLNPLDMMR